MKNMDRKERYGLRKLSIGLASVLLSIAFYKGTVPTVQAATEVGQSQQALTSLQDKQEVANSKANKTATKPTSTKAAAKAKTAPVPASQAAEQQPQAKTVQKADSIAKTAASKAASPQPMQAKPSKTAAKSDKDSKQVKASVSEKVEIDKLGSKDSKISKDKLAKELKTSLRREAIPPASQQASQYDPSKPDEWGQVDIDDWDYDNATNNGSISLTGYHGNRDHIVIPNDQDFIKTKNHHFDPGQGVYISSDKMRRIMTDNKPKTLAISQTTSSDGKKGKVIAGNTNNTDRDWCSAFGGDALSGYGIQSTDPNIEKMDLTNLDTHNVKYMHDMLAGRIDGKSRLTAIGDLSNWDMSSCCDIDGLFEFEPLLENVGDLDNWNTSKVGTDPRNPDYPGESMANVFRNDKNLVNVGRLDHWDTSHVLDMEGMFAGTDSLHQIGNIGNWDVSKVQGFEAMFSGTGLINPGDLGNWDTRSGLNMEAMFMGANKLSDIGHLDNWDTSQVGQMDNMFNGTPELTDIGDTSAKTVTAHGRTYKAWDTSQTWAMSGMFEQTGIQHLNISGWDFAAIVSHKDPENAGDPQLGNFASWNKDQIIIANDLTVNGQPGIPDWMSPAMFNSYNYDYDYDSPYYHIHNHMANAGHDIIITNMKGLLKLETDYPIHDPNDNDAQEKNVNNSRIVFNGNRFYRDSVSNDNWLDYNYLPTDQISGYSGKIEYNGNTGEFAYDPNACNYYYMPTFFDSTSDGAAPLLTAADNAANRYILKIVHSKADPALQKESDYLSGKNGYTGIGEYKGKKIRIIPGFNDRNNPFNWVDGQFIVELVSKQHAHLLFYDDTEGKLIAAQHDDKDGDADSPIDFDLDADAYDLNNLISQHYQYVGISKGKAANLSDQTNPDPVPLASYEFGDFDEDETTDQYFVVHLKHTYQQISETKVIKETIHYVYEDGSQAEPDYIAHSIEFQGTGTKDLVTGQVSTINWQPASYTFASVLSPLIPGYTADPAEIAAQIVNADSNNLVFTVVYRKNQTPPPYIPPKKPGHKPGNHPSNKPGQKPSNKPNNRPNNKPNKKPNSKPSRQPQKRSFRSARHLTQRSRQLAKKSQQQLPQTGSQEGLMAAGLLSLALSAALAANDRKKYRQ